MLKHNPMYRESLFTRKPNVQRVLLRVKNKDNKQPIVGPMRAPDSVVSFRRRDHDDQEDKIEHKQNKQ